MSETLHLPKAALSPPPQARPPRAPSTPGLSIVVAVVIVAALYYGREVLIPITIAVLLSFVLSPLVELLRQVWLGHILSVILTVVLALGIILAVGTAIGSQVAQLAGYLPQYQQTIEQKITTLRDTTIKRLSDRISSLGHQLAPPAPRPATSPATAGSGRQSPGESQAEQEKPIPVVVQQPSLSALQIGKNVLTPLLNPLATAGIILVVTIFTLLQKEDLRDRAIRLFGSSDLQRTTVAMDDAARRLSRYFLIQLGINTSFGLIVATGLYFIGLPNPVLWGILGALLRFIPYIGSWIAAVVSIALAAAVEPGWSMAIWTAVLYAGTELIMGQAVEPLVYGHSTGLSPVAVVIAAIFWTWVWGPIGLIISTPLTLCLVVIGRHTDRLEFLDILLGDQPALSPVESFYQRMLADDPDEAEEQADRYLKDRPLSSYYDEVALKGLQLAAADIDRGALPPPKAERLKEAINGLVHELDGYGDEALPAAAEEKAIAGPTSNHELLPKTLSPGDDLSDKPELASQWRGNAPILCITGRGPLDEAASRMLAQLLGKHGLGARIVPYDAVSRANIASLDVREVAMMCISYLDISGNPAHLRYLLRRLRERLPQVPILVGLWPAQDAVLKDQNIRQAVGADHYVSTFHDAVDACVTAAHQVSIRPANQCEDV